MSGLIDGAQYAAATAAVRGRGRRRPGNGGISDGAFRPFGPQDKRFLEIRVVPGGAAQQGAIAAAGRCRAQFTALMPDHAFIVRIPLKSLDADDFICLTDQLGTIAHQAVIAR